MTVREQYADSPDGARAYLSAAAALPGIEDAVARADEQVRGVWEVAGRGWIAIVYLAGYPGPWGHERERNDFEVAFPEGVS